MQVQFGEFTLDTDTRQLRHGADERHLSPKAFDLLRLLIENRASTPGCAFGRSDSFADQRRYGYYSYMIRSVNIAELKNRLSLYLNDVRTGKEILIRDRNTPIARIVPVARGADDDEELHALAAQGRLRLGEKSLDGAFWDLPAPRVPAHVLKRALQRERNEDEGR